MGKNRLRRAKPKGAKDFPQPDYSLWNLGAESRTPDGQMDSFGDNPFSCLDARLFPDLQVKGEKDTDIISGEDKALFLRALQNLRASSKKKKLGGFLLAEQCSLPRIEKKKMEKKTHVIRKEKAGKDSKLEEGLDAFLLAMRNAKPLPGKGREVVPGMEAKKNAAMAEPGFEELLGQSLEFTLMYSDEYLEGHVAGLDELIMNRLRAGQMSPEAHLDLHGLNAEQAFETLRVFMRDAWFKSLRTVLVVTGRGLNSPFGQGVLRRKLQTWLTQEPFKRVVLGFCTARPHDGGPGSIYVLLRKFRKKGRISWDRYSGDADLYQNSF